MLKGYRNDHYKVEGEIYNTMLNIAIKNNSFDMRIYDVYLEIKQWLENLSFMNSILKVAIDFDDRYYYTGEQKLSKKETQMLLCKMLKYNKFRLDYTNYKLPEPKPIVIPIEDLQIEEESEEECPLMNEVELEELLTI
jgi:hypothetical protein